MDTKNPHADENGNPKPGQFFEWVQWVEDNGDDSLDALSPDERSREVAARTKFQERMASEGFPS